MSEKKVKSSKVKSKKVHVEEPQPEPEVMESNEPESQPSKHRGRPPLPDAEKLQKAINSIQKATSGREKVRRRYTYVLKKALPKAKARANELAEELQKLAAELNIVESKEGSGKAEELIESNIEPKEE